MLHNAAPGQGAPAPLVGPLGTARSAGRPERALTPPPTLILYDTTGAWGSMGELYAVGTANLVGHFGPWETQAATAYGCGTLPSYAALIYLGSTYDEPLPACLLDDVLASTRPVIWSFYNVGQLVARAGGDAAFAVRFGWSSAFLDFSPISQVVYKGRALSRYAANAAGVMAPAVSDPALATVLATAVKEGGATVPWAVRSGSFTYLSEVPFSYMSEGDRVLVFADLLFDALAAGTVEQHRAVVRLEDLDPTEDPAPLMAIADALQARSVPFGFGLVPSYRDPLGVYTGGVPELVSLPEAPETIAALEYLVSKGGTLVLHGQTHQWDTDLNPYDRVTGDDAEFFRVVGNPDNTLSWTGPLPGDSAAWATERILTAQALVQQAGLAAPTIFEFPHYAASATDYQAALTQIGTRWERSLYFPGQLRGGAVGGSGFFGQLFPYVVKDVYGAKVLPENLGCVEPTPFYSFPARLPADLIGAAAAHLVVRDGVAGFYFHPSFDLAYLTETVDGLQALGYTFVSPTSL